MSEKKKPTFEELQAAGFGCMMPGVTVSADAKMTLPSAPVAIAVDILGTPQAELLDTQELFADELKAASK